MDNALLIGTQTQRVLQRRMEIAANNLANANTTGFKASAMLNQATDGGGEARSHERPRDIRFVRDEGLAQVMAQGALARTGNPLDIAIQGEGFIPVQTEAGLAYTRDGALQMGADGRLQTRDGRPVLNEAGAPIVFDPQGAPPAISADGAVRVGEIVVGRIGLVGFERPQALEKLGDNLFRPVGQAPGPFTGELVQGALEASNVNPVLELSEVIEISRAYQSASRFVGQADDLRARAIERLGRI